ncbi:MAG: AbrB/MazE/SpoVT family DNA-binding domain-containing protein [Spirochaeta sp.]|nr:AbrB/MazE/SpoVT family DNA-binding domain-containing protein [Spirochaeta sp.]
MNTKVGERGQVTIPKALRDRYGIQPGMELEFCESADGIVLRKQDLGRTLERLKGTVKIGDLSTDEFLAGIRDGEE